MNQENAGQGSLRQQMPLLIHRCFAQTLRVRLARRCTEKAWEMYHRFKRSSTFPAYQTKSMQKNTSSGIVMEEFEKYHRSLETRPCLRSSATSWQSPPLVGSPQATTSPCKGEVNHVAWSMETRIAKFYVCIYIYMVLPKHRKSGSCRLIKDLYWWFSHGYRV